MLLLTSTTDIIRIVTSASASVTCSVSWVDNNLSTGAITPGGDVLAPITSNTTTTVVPSPASGVIRNVKALYFTNNHATAGTQVTPQHFDGTNSADLVGVYLLPGENLCFREDGSWVHRDANGAEYGYSNAFPDPSSQGYVPSGFIAENIPRHMAGVNISALTSGSMFMQAIYLRAGTKVSNLSCASATTASATQTNRWMALYTNTLALVGQTANQGSTALAANTIYTAALPSTYTCPYTGIYYIGIMVTATTVCTLAGVTGAASATGLRTAAPVLSGNSTTGLTTTAPAPAGTITPLVNTVWVAVS